MAAAQRNRGTLLLEDASVLRKLEYPGDQFVLRLSAPGCAARATAGSFVHIQCDDSIAMRRPLSIMRADADAGWIEVLFKFVGAGLRALGDAKVGDALSIIGPIGHGFAPHPERPIAIMIGGGVGIPPIVFLAEQLLAEESDWEPMVFMGSELPFPFEVERSAIETEWLPPEVSGTMPLLERRGICTRLASLSGFAHCFDGYVTELARRFIATLSPGDRARAQIFSCGPTPMLKATAALASEFSLPCQVSLEEFMACAVGGCAGCTVEVRTASGPAMKRVCVDGPVFEANTVFDTA